MKTLPFLALAALAAAPAFAQYKVVAPDGSVTYTDRPPVAADVKITPLSRKGVGAPAPDAELPLALRQAVQRYPVTLYTGADCAPCDNARTLLQQRGVPYAEKRVGSDEDAQALEKLSGARTIPVLAVGAQVLRGLSTDEWSATLDAAGYPRESRLPRTWLPPAPAPVVERAPPTPAAAPQSEPVVPPPVLPGAESPAAPRIRF